MIGITEIISFLVPIFWIIFIVLVFLIIKHLINRSKISGVEGKSAFDIINEKYARGEITEDKFEETKKKMKSISALCYSIIVAFLLCSAYLLYSGFISIIEAIVFDAIILVIILLFRYLGHASLTY
jgi:putative membrane protein